MAYQIGEAVLRYATLTLCFMLPFVAAAETLSERKVIHTVDLRSVAENPSVYAGLRVQFRGIFATRGSLFDSFHSQFKPDQYVNLVVWDDQAGLWSPEARANPAFALYYQKSRNQTALVSGLKKYQVIDVVGEVHSTFKNQPWLDIHSVSLVDGAGTYSDASVFLLQQANQLAAENSYDLAEQNFVAALQTPLNQDIRVSVLEMRAKNLLAWGKFQESIAVLEEALALHKSWLGDTLPTKLSQLYYLSAKGYSEAAADAQSEGAVVDGAMGSDYFQKSIDHAKLAVELEPENGDAYAILGIGLSGLEHYDEARTHCQRAILMRPSNAEIRWYLGRILDRQGDFDEAINVLNRAIDLSPKDYRIHKTIALVYYHKSETRGKTSEEDRVTALREFDIAIRLNGLDADLFYFSGLVIERASDAGGKVRVGRDMIPATKALAAERYMQCIDLDDSYLPAFLALAEYNRGITKHDEAVTYYKRALALAPEKEELYGKLATYFYELGRLADAYDVHAAYQVRQPKHLDTLYALGNLSLQLKEYQRSADWLEVLVKQEPKHAKAHADLSDTYVELAAWRDAISHADAALALLEDGAEKTRVSHKKGIAHWALDDVANTLSALSGNSEGATDIRVLLALGWAQTLDESAATAALASAQAAVAIDAKNADAQELLGWAQYLNADYANAEKTLAAITLSKELAGYRLGMVTFKQGPERYADASAFFKDGKNLRDKRSILRNTSKDISLAERAITEYDRDVARQAAADKRAADKQAAADKRQQDADAKQKAIDDKNKANADAKQKAADEKLKAENDKKAAEAEKARKAAEEKQQAADAKQKAADDKRMKEAEAKRLKEEAKAAPK